MNNFNKILEAEKKYQQVISKAQKNILQDKEKFYEDLKLKEEAIKSDFKAELERDYKRSIEDYKKQGEDILTKANLDAENILKFANINDAVKLLEEEMKNV